MVDDRLQDITQAAHDIGMAAWFGGVLFGRLAHNPSLKLIGSESERGGVANAAWNAYNVVNLLSLGAVGLGHLAGRMTELRSENLGPRERPLVAAMDFFTAASVATGVLSGIQGGRLAGQAPGGRVPIRSGTRPSPRTPEHAAALQRSLDRLGALNVAAGVGLITSTGMFWRSAVSRPPKRRALRRSARR
jgi:hypothetical protein